MMLARGRIVADGSASEIGALVGSKVVRATLREADLDAPVPCPGWRRSPVTATRSS
ncbi:MAG: hypothetical protein R2711_17990 [Acidimicrobiales bacterium]